MKQVPMSNLSTKANALKEILEEWDLLYVSDNDWLDICNRDAKAFITKTFNAGRQSIIDEQEQAKLLKGFRRGNV